MNLSRFTFLVTTQNSYLELFFYKRLCVYSSSGVVNSWFWILKCLHRDTWLLRVRMCVCSLLKVGHDGESVICNIWACTVLMNWNDLFSSYRSDTVQYQCCQFFIKHFLWELSGTDTCTHTHRDSPLEPTDASSRFYIDSCVNEKADNAHIEACSADMCMSDEAGQRWCCDWSRRRNLTEEKVCDSTILTLCPNRPAFLLHRILQLDMQITAE